MSKTVAISQSNYIPWKGYFDIIQRVDHFILYDDMQFTRRDWRNRNQIKTPQGLQWLTIPVEVKGKYHQKICETKIAGTDWAEKHWQTLRQNYRKAACFAKFEPQFEKLYAGAAADSLSDINLLFLKALCEMLQISTPIDKSMNYRLVDGQTEKLVDLCKQVGATRYLSGPAAKDYLDEALFTHEDIAVEYMDYSDYPPYRQLYGEFAHGVSVIDLLFNEGSRAREFLKYSNVRPQVEKH